jgi:hypothetical protein
MEKNKTGKYLKYAIGEIVLVVIGILIALQINNWNEQRKNILNEKELYSRIVLDLQLDEKRINQYIKYYKDDQSMLHHMYQDSQGLWDNDSLINFSTLRAVRIFNLTIEANYSKFTKEISEPEIGEKINIYFGSENNVNDALGYLWDFKVVQVRPFLSKYGINNTSELFNNHQLDYYDLREKNIFSYSKLKEQYGSVEFDQLLFDLGIKTSWALSALETLLASNKSLQLDLKNELSGKSSSIEK